MTVWLKTLLVCGLALAWVEAQEEVQIDIGQGALKGLKVNTVYHKKPYYSFRGIPYAKPNVGRDKFRMPEPAGPWEGVLDATQYRSSCPFYCMIRQGLMGQEDCLYINVFTPELGVTVRNPVLVVINGGHWQGSSGDDDFFGPDFMVEQDVIVVTFNYRLGAIGYLNTGDANAPGNAGMKDQVMALKWVQDNIDVFGGCPNRVTILGQCSGGASVQYHMLSPMSEGLFRGAIMQSGSALNPWAISHDSRELAFKLGEFLGIRTTDTAELVDKLKDFSAEEIIGATGEVAKTQNALNGHTASFIPSVEADVGQEIFLPADSWDLMKNGKLNDVSLMIGLTSDESIMFAQMLGPFAEQMNDNFEVFLPYDLNVTDAGRMSQMARDLKAFYFGDKKISPDTRMEEYKMMLDDIMFTCGTALTLKILSARSKELIYEYLFTYDDPTTVMKSLLHIDKGVIHGDEMTFLFYSNVFKILPQPDSPAEKMTRMMSKMWANFIREENPTPDLDDDIKTKWEIRGTDDNYLNINLEPKMEKGLFADRVRFCEELYKDNLGSFA